MDKYNIIDELGDDEEYELPVEEEIKELDFDKPMGKDWGSTFERDFERELEELEDLEPDEENEDIIEEELIDDEESTQN